MHNKPIHYESIIHLTANKPLSPCFSDLCLCTAVDVCIHIPTRHACTYEHQPMLGKWVKDDGT